MILVDTNVFSELTKPIPDPNVVDWLFRHRNETLLSTIVVAEIDIGVRTTSGADKRKMLSGWLGRLIEAHAERVIDFDLRTARRWAAIGAPLLIDGRRLGSRGFDTLIAAQALERNVPVATRNGHDFEGVGLEIINPWHL
jgi:toxin FitB